MPQVTIAKGDTLGALAKKYGTTVADLMAANKGNASVKTQDMIYAGGMLNIPDKVGAPAAGPAAPSATGSISQNPVQSAGAQAVGDLGNFRTVMRDALNEAARGRIETQYKQLAPLSNNIPGTIGSVVDMIRSGVKTPVENVFSDAVKMMDDRRKEMEFNPDQYRTVQNGIYDIKNNEWVVKPKGDGSGVALIGGVPVSSNTKQILDGFTSVNDLTPTAQAAAKKELYALGFDKQEPPAWYVTEIENDKQMNLTPSARKREWDLKRNRTLFGKQFLTSDFLSGVYGKAEITKNAKSSNMTENEYLSSLESRIQTYRDAGFSDDEILKFMQ